MAHEFYKRFRHLMYVCVISKSCFRNVGTRVPWRFRNCLTDVVGMDAFLRDFDLYFAKLFDGLRHDSGDPYEWGDKAYAHYRKLKLIPKPKC